jgi:EF hand domain-containing protein
MSIRNSLCRPAVFFALSAPLFFLAGCQSSSMVPKVDPEEAVASAMEQFDKNGDGELDKSELAACPALLDALGEYDTNGNKMIGRDELALRIGNMYSRKISLTAADCKVTLNKKPLAGAKILFVPEEFLGAGTTVAAEGVTDQFGLAIMAIPAENLPEELRRHKKTQVGVYRVEITHPSKTIPAKYNTQTELGYEVHPDSHNGSHAFFHLENK